MNTLNIYNTGNENVLRDYGDEPLVFNIDGLTKYNTSFRTTLWTGEHLQLTLMSIDVGGDIGLEMHTEVDQFLRIESGRGIVRIGKEGDVRTLERVIDDNFAIIIPAGTWHNILNAGNTPLKLYSIYAPPQHPYGTVHKTRADSDAAEH